MSDSKKLGVAIIGTGAVADHHAAAIRDARFGELISVCSSSPERAWEAAGRFGVRAYSDFKSLLEKEPRVQAVIICTSSGKHLGPALAAAAAGKHVICEKPLEVDLDRADQMIAACRRGGVKLACIFQNRYSPDFIKMKEAVSDGRLGKIVLGNAYIKWYRSADYYASSAWRGTLKGDGGAAFINQGIHTIDLLQHLLGPVGSVYAQTRTRVHDIEGEDAGAAILNFRSGALGTVEASTALWPGRPEQLAVYGEQGRIVMEGGQITEWEIQGDTSGEKAKPKTASSGASDPMAIGHALHLRQLDEIFEDLLAGRDPVVNGEEGRKALQVVRAIYLSAETGEAIDLRNADAIT